MIESDLLDEEYQGPTLAKLNEWRMGVEINEWGRPVRYAFLTRHPGDYWFQNAPQKGDKHVFLSCGGCDPSVYSRAPATASRSALVPFSDG